MHAGPVRRRAAVIRFGMMDSVANQCQPGRPDGDVELTGRYHNQDALGVERGMVLVTDR